ncbi:Inactivated superfamily I helicase [Bacteroidales bacterium Barb6XT]|nr:Inactivated superfamily I helicase [Bacteroidales bacterium Barb6XT]
MGGFLQEIAKGFYDRFGGEVCRLAFVFPNRRAGVFFKKYLEEAAASEGIPVPLFSPGVMTTGDLFLLLGGKQAGDRIGLLFTLYRVFREISGSGESFDEFLYWGELLLNDFDEADRYLVNAGRLFRNVTDLKELEGDWEFLSGEQVDAVRTFWASFDPKGDWRGEREFRSVWELLLALYEGFRERLTAEGTGYEGMLFREVTENLDEERCRALGYEGFVFVGLNALSGVEERLLGELRDMGLADFYWDYGSGCVRDVCNGASFFVKRNLERFPSRYDFGGTATEDYGGAVIEVIGVPSGTGQAKVVHGLLSEWCEKGELEGEGALRTAVVLPDEGLLVPVLHSIPEGIEGINVTMGCRLSGTPAAALVEAVTGLYRNVRFSEGGRAFYFRDVLGVLNHRYVSGAVPAEAARLAGDITRYNRVYVSGEELCVCPLLRIIFGAKEGAEGLAECLGELLSFGFPEGVFLSALDSEYLFYYFTVVNRLRDLLEGSGVQMKTETFGRLLKRAAGGVSIPFRGEPLGGVQVMGVLETRALDFDRVILLSMNEGVFPQGRSGGSFIPYNLRRGFGLPTYEHRDGVQAYHFYRLIGRARQVCLVYDSRTTGVQTGEVSRFVHQLQYHYEVPLVRKQVVYGVSSSKAAGLSVPKGDEVLRCLEEFYKGGRRAVSASAVNTYLDCPLKFYFSTVEETREEEMVSEAVESSMFGSILHGVLERLYEGFCGRGMVDSEGLKALRKDKRGMTGIIETVFAKVFFKSGEVRPLTGQNYLIGEMIRKYAERVLEVDGRLTPFRYTGSERKVSGLFGLSNGREVQLKGFIDRLDEVNGVLRIIDYKSGAGTVVFPSVDSLFDREAKDRAKAVMQVFMYAMMYRDLPEGKDRAVQPGIYYMRSLFAPGFDSCVMRKIDRGKFVRVEDFREYEGEFRKAFRGCLDGLFGDDTAFGQAVKGKGCGYCRFAGICGR